MIVKRGWFVHRQKVESGKWRNTITGAPFSIHTFAETTTTVTNGNVRTKQRAFIVTTSKPLPHAGYVAVNGFLCQVDSGEMGVAELRDYTLTVIGSMNV